ncbi:MAG: alpha/beta hydrolase [Blautia sp.]|nr:alpha/beta hydrolase [Blautia sp.]
MSVFNSILCSILRKGKKPFDPGNPRDYVKAREEELRQVRFFKTPKSVDISLQKMNEVPVEIITKQGNPKDRIVFYTHGGGFCTGAVESKRMFTTCVADKLGYNVAAVDYRLAPEHPFPAGLNDCYTVYDRLCEDYGAKNIFILGESAGGNLTLATLLMEKAHKGRLPAGAAVFSPTLQFVEELDSYRENYARDAILTNIVEEMYVSYLQTDDREITKNPYVSPLLGDFTGFPPVFITYSENEVLRDDSVKLIEKLKKQRVRVEFISHPDTIHAHPIITSIPEAKRDLKEVRRFIDKCFV